MQNAPPMMKAPFAIREGARTQGLDSQDGLVVVRLGWMGFLPTDSKQNLAAELGLTLVGATTISGRPVRYDLSALMAQGDAAFDAQVQNLAAATGVLWKPAQAHLTLTAVGSDMAVVWVAANDQRVATLLPLNTPPELIAEWQSLDNPAPTAAQLRQRGKMFASIGALFVFPVGALIYGALTRDPWMWLGVAFWAALPLVLLKVWLGERARHLAHAREVAAGRATPAALRPALELWPTVPARGPAVPAGWPAASAGWPATATGNTGNIVSAVTQVAPPNAGKPTATPGWQPLSPAVVARHLVQSSQPSYALPLLLRGMLGALVDYLAIIASAVAIGVHWPAARLIIAALPLILFVYHAALLTLRGATFGGSLLDVIVTTTTGKPLPVQRAALRVLLLWLNWMLLSLFSLFMVAGLYFFAKRRGGLPHDVYSKTQLAWRH